MAKPAADDRDIDARRDKVHGGGVTEAVWRHMLGSQDGTVSAAAFT
ncbi:hypothetical protein LJR234_000071 [Mesorhizobium amorphae]